MSTDFTKHQQEMVFYENELKTLKSQFQQIHQSASDGKPPPNPSEEVRGLIADNAKLTHRLNILTKAIEAESQRGANFTREVDRMESVQEHLNGIAASAIAKAFPDLPDAPVVVTLGNNPKFGDYQCNSALPIANLFKQSGNSLSPVEIAKKIVANMPESPMIEKVSIAGPGFINIYLNKSYGVRMLSTIFEKGVQPPDIGTKRRVLVDFSSPNIAKEMHVGHLRSTIIGESICRLLEFLGHTVLRINHVGDWGTQFGMLIAHLSDKFPDYLDNPEAIPIADLQNLYRESKVRFDEDPEFKQRAYESVVKLQNSEPKSRKVWEAICQISRREFQKIYNRLDITITERGESFYQAKMEAMVEELEKGGYLEEDEGRKIMWGGEGENKGKIPLTVIKSDGGFTYDTSDISALKHRLYEDKCDWIIYVTDAGQATHFEIVFDCARRIGFLKDSHRIDHVGFGVVLDENKKKFKTRSGDTIKLNELLDEGLRRAMDKLKEKQRDQVLSYEELVRAQESIAFGCIKYADLSHNRNHDYVFSFDKMLEDKGNTAVYLLYAYTRIRSIARNVNFDSEKVKEIARKVSISVGHEKEWKLVKTLLKFPDVLIKITKDLCLHHLCEYVYEIATNFTEFYDSCYCIEKDSSGDIVKINEGRILLTEATAMVLERCFDILGLKPVSKM